MLIEKELLKHLVVSILFRTFAYTNNKTMNMSKRKEQYKANKALKVGSICICPICRKEFTKTHYAQAFCCNECKVKFHNDRQRGKRNDYFHRYNMKHPRKA